MQTYPLDADPGQLVRWLMAEHERAPSALKIAARRAIEVRDIPAQSKLHLGDEEREDLTEVAVTGILEIAPRHTSDGWLLRVIVEDEAGPRVPDRDAGVEPEQQVDLGTFYRQFIRPERGIATVVAEVENAAAEGRVRRLIDAITVNRHTGDGTP
ncbi:MAG TPA: hypothetical protein VK438_04715 [Xanthobacteraceae bacterium]|nr:hypothetical protein [Xanthobacteraceae bacterium]